MTTALPIIHIQREYFAGRAMEVVGAAADLGISRLLAHEACATRSLSFHGLHVSARDLQAAGRAGRGAPFAEVVSADESLVDL